MELDANPKAKAFVRFKRAMASPYHRGEFDLGKFVDFVAQHWGEHGEMLLDAAIRRWCGRIPGRKAVTLGNEFGVVRRLCLYRRRTVAGTIRRATYLNTPLRQPSRQPSTLISLAMARCSGPWPPPRLTMATPHHGRCIWASMLRTLILILYCTGLRFGEAVRLRMIGADLDRGTLMIGTSKRRLPPATSEKPTR